MPNQTEQTFRMRLRKRTLHKLVFEDVPTPGRAPAIETLYLSDWYLPDAKEIEVTIREVEP